VVWLRLPPHHIYRSPLIVLWYQGESDSFSPPAAYQCQLESLVMEWRGALNLTAMPFFAVQLAPYWEPPCPVPPTNATTPCGIGSQYPAIRIAQARAMARVEAETGAPSGYCVTHDIGDVSQRNSSAKSIRFGTFYPAAGSSCAAPSSS
jgi:hypothetical protein